MLSPKLLPRLGTRGKSRADPLTESGHKIPSRALVASKFHIGPQQRTVTLRVCKKFEPETWSLRFVARMWFPRHGLYVSSTTQQTEAGFSWKAKGQGTSGVAPRRRRGPDSEGSVLGRFLWKPTPNRQSERERGSKQREG